MYNAFKSVSIQWAQLAKLCSWKTQGRWSVFFRLNIIRTVNYSFFDLWAEAQQPCTAIALPPTLTYTPSYQRKIFSIQSAHVLREKKIQIVTE